MTFCFDLFGMDGARVQCMIEDKTSTILRSPVRYAEFKP